MRSKIEYWHCNNCETDNNNSQSACEVCGGIPPQFIDFSCSCNDINEPTLCRCCVDNVETLFLQIEDQKPFEIFKDEFAVDIQKPTRLTLIAVNAIAERRKTIKVEIAKPIIANFEVDNETVLEGDTIIVKWKVVNAETCAINDVKKVLQGEERISAYEKMKIEAMNSAGLIRKDLVLTIYPRPIIAFSVSTQKIHVGKDEKVILMWNVQNAEQCSLIAPDGTNENCEPQGAATITPTETCTYTLRTLALDKRTTIDTPLTINVYPDAQVEFASDKGYIFPSIPFTLSWKVRYAKRVTLNGKLVKATDTITYDSGIEKDTTYVLRVTDEFGEKDYYLTIKMLPIPQINTILVPTPHINENINITTNVPTPTLNIRFPQPRLQNVELLDMNKYDVHVETNIVPPIHLIIPRFELKEQSLFERIYNKLNKILKHNGNEIK